MPFMVDYTIHEFNSFTGIGIKLVVLEAKNQFFTYMAAIPGHESIFDICKTNLKKIG